MSARKIDGFKRDWVVKTLVGAVLGWSLALALSGLFAWVGPGGLSAPDKVQFNMWIIAPLWMLALSGVYVIRSGGRALVYFLLANTLSYAFLMWSKTAMQP